MLKERPGNPLRNRDEQSLIGEDLDQRGVREPWEIDGAAIVHIRSVVFESQLTPMGSTGDHDDRWNVTDS